jgi:hypothetical protein
MARSQGRSAGRGPLTGICVLATRLTAAIAPLLTATAADGSYLLAGLQPGRYLVEFFADCGATGFRTQWWDDARSAGAATPVTVVAGATKAGIDAAMVP